ncbi:hypothetical protein CXF83_06385 [Shewanella sp. Choline-02u-19]|uniref:hypothetical protein n=1 Tax=unclassified Shewanella TaxID=196818 RepID=UPI000C3478E2|nr:MULTISPECIES: hypothetical protein [unclassified Shewanella]PKH56712.1 hypothetical protein CXF84_12405 [Shewanella sp. Bg11-22]PKI30263.1 hypothetical protein CXF83_06385 [Shewanella sp. Choline-02u-19]
MLDAVCLYDETKPITYSVFKFQKLSDADIEKYRQALLCPACAGKAYYRKASKDGKAACFGSRYHQADCAEFKPSAAKEREEQHAIEVNQLVVDSDALIIDFSCAPKMTKAKTPSAVTKVLIENETQSNNPTVITPMPVAADLSTAELLKPELTGPTAVKTEDETSAKKRVATQGLEKVLHSLLRGSDLATSDLWVYTDDKYRWRAKNLFVNFADAEPTENGAPRLYWGTISHTDKERLWLNPAETKDVGIPIDMFANSLISRFGLEDRRDFEGAGIILFGKCFWNKAKSRKIIQLWSNDVSRLFISKADESD